MNQITTATPAPASKKSLLTFVAGLLTSCLFALCICQPAVALTTTQVESDAYFGDEEMESLPDVEELPPIDDHFVSTQANSKQQGKSSGRAGNRFGGGNGDGKSGSGSGFGMGGGPGGAGVGGMAPGGGMGAGGLGGEFGGMGAGGLGGDMGGGGMGAGGPGGGRMGGGGMGMQDGEEDMAEMMGGPMGQPVKLVLRIYPVGDLIKQSTNSHFNGFVLPGLSSGLNPTLSSGQQGAGGGGGFGGGPSGGGVFAVPSSGFQGMGGLGGGGGGLGGRHSGNSISTTELSIVQLMNVVMDSIAANTWDHTGGVGTATFMRDMLVINQTEAVHKQIDTFLKMVRASTSPKPTVTIKAVWLTIDEDLFQSLDIEADQQVNSKVLAQLVKSHGRRAQVTCFDGETAHVAAGNLKSSIESVVPVVGQNEIQPKQESRIASLPRLRNQKPVPAFVMAQSFGDDDSGLQELGIKKSNSNVGYQPISRWINYGAVLTVQPQVDDDLKMLTLTVGSILVEGPDEAGPATSGIGNRNKLGDGFGVNLENHNLKTQQFQSHVRLKHATPTLVGGAAFKSGSNVDQTYLIVEAIVNND